MLLLPRRRHRLATTAAGAAAAVVVVRAVLVDMHMHLRMAHSARCMAASQSFGTHPLTPVTHPLTPVTRALTPVTCALTPVTRAFTPVTCAFVASVGTCKRPHKSWLWISAKSGQLSSSCFPYCSIFPPPLPPSPAPFLLPPLFSSPPASLPLASPFSALPLRPLSPDSPVLSLPYSTPSPLSPASPVLCPSLPAPLPPAFPNPRSKQRTAIRPPALVPSHLLPAYRPRRPHGHPSCHACPRRRRPQRWSHVHLRAPLALPALHNAVWARCGRCHARQEACVGYASLGKQCFCQLFTR
eukprot:365525-Chlamydomonas_euryale.AAC.7